MVKGRVGYDLPCAHSFTRNRTRGLNFPPSSFLALKVLNAVPRCSRVSFSRRERIDLHRWMCTISREAAFVAGGLLA
jgi:hypothetical protein